MVRVLIHEHVWEDFPMPAEPRGRIVRCQSCGVIGHRRHKQTKIGNGHHRMVAVYTCTKGSCTEPARGRAPGRGHGASYNWRCAAHQPAP